MHAWESIQNTVEYIEAHMTENIEIETLAQIAALSPFYYQRLFSRLVGKPVREYTKLRRLAKATELLADKQKRILDIALSCGFSSHETFTRTFKEAFGLTPEKYRKNPVRLNNFTKPQLLLNYVLIDEDVPLISDGIVLEITRKKITQKEYFLGLSSQYPVSNLPTGKDTAIDYLAEIWDTFHKEKQKLTRVIDGNKEVGVTSLGESEGYFTYFAGAQVKTMEVIEDFTSWQLAPGEYIVCSFEAENFEKLVMDVLYKALKYLFEIWLPKHGFCSLPFCLERYNEHSPQIASMEIWVSPLAIKNT